MSKGMLGLEITTSKLRYVYADKKGKSVHILKAGQIRLPSNSTKAEDVSAMIRDLLSKENMKPARVFLTLSRQDTLIRHVKLPKMSPQDLEDVVRSEIEKIPSFLNNRFDFIYKNFPAKTEKNDVVFAAVNQKILDNLMDGVRQTKMSFRHLDITPLNLQDYLYRNFSSHPHQVVLVVNDLVSYFVIFKDHQFRLLYKTAMGTEHLFPEKDGKLDIHKLTNLSGELQRVLKSYQSENKEENIHEFTLIWDHEGAEAFSSEIEEKLKLGVRIPKLAEFTGDKNPLPAEYENPIYLMALLPILYEFSSVKPLFAFNHFFRAMHLKKYALRAFVIGLLVCLAGASVLGVLAYDFSRKSRVLTEKTRSIKADVRELKVTSKDLYEKRDEYQAMREGLLNQATFVKLLNRISWTEVLEVVAKKMPENMGLTSFKFGERGGAEFRGESFQMEEVSDLIRKVDTSEVLTNGRFDFLIEDFVEETKIFQFGILARIGKPASEAEKTSEQSEDLDDDSSGSQDQETTR